MATVQPVDGTPVSPDAMTNTAFAQVLLTPGGSDSLAAGNNASTANVQIAATGSGGQTTNAGAASLHIAATGTSAWASREATTTFVTVSAAGSDSGPQPPNLPQYANAPANVVLTAGGASAITTQEAALALLLLEADGTAQLTAPVVTPTRYFYTRKYAQAAIGAAGGEQSAFVGNIAPLLAIAPQTDDTLQLGNTAAGVTLMLTPAGTSYRSIIDSSSAVLLTLSAIGAARLQTREAALTAMTALPGSGDVLRAVCIAPSSLLISCAAYTYLTQHTGEAASLTLNAQGSDAVSLTANTAANVSLAGVAGGLLRTRDSASVQILLGGGANATFLAALAQTGANVALSAG